MVLLAPHPLFIITVCLMKKFLPMNTAGKTRLNHPRLLLLVFIFYFIPGVATSFSQLPQPANRNLDQLFLEARELAFDQQGEAARSLCRQILEQNAGYHDASILMARTYAWEGAYQEASGVLEGVLINAPGNDAAIVAMADVKMWGGDYSQAIVYLDEALSSAPNNLDLLYQKALALNHLGDRTPAVILLNQILDIDPTHARAEDLLGSIQDIKIRNYVGAGYRVDLFDQRDPWHLGYLEYGRRTRALGTVIGRLNYANRFDQKGFQVEADAYPAIAEGTYLYLNGGYSPDGDLFPTYRAGFEVFQQIPREWEASLGFRLLTFNRNDLMILTGSISKYYKKYYFSFRPYINMAAEGPGSQSYYVTIRRYFSAPDHYLSLLLGTGFSADEDALVGGEMYNIGSNKALLQYQQRVSTNWLLKAGAGYQHYNEGIWGDKYTLEFGAAYLF